MNKTVLAILYAGIWAMLVSCSSSKDDEPMAVMPSEPPETLTIPAGMSASEASPVYATNESDTIVALMRSAATVFAPLTSTLDRSPSEGTGTVLGEDFHIKSIASDGSGGFNVSYVVGEEERLVRFASADFEGPGCDDNTWCSQDDEGRRYWFWNLSDQLEYTNAYGGSFPGGNRPYFVFGSRTESDNLPSGSASWFGRMYVQSYKQDNPSNDERLTMDGRILLTADFAQGDLTGRIQALRSRGDDGIYRALEDSTSRFEISDGKMIDGQFVASLTGQGDASVQGDGTVRGYEGNLLGEFYGPEANELGGVVNAKSDSHERVLAGHFTGDALNTTAGDKVPAISVTTLVDRQNSSVSSSDLVGVESVQRDGSGGFRVAYTGRTVHLDASDLANDPVLPYGYHKRIGNKSYYLWDTSNSFYTDPEFDYMNFAGWAITNYAAGSDDFSQSTSHSGYMAYGMPTAVGELPSGTASYSGRAFAQILPRNDTRGSARSLYRGDLSLTADFSADTIGGMIDGIEVRGPGQSSYQSSGRVWNIANGTISGNGLSADLIESGNVGTAVSMEGGFYGSNGEEVGGVLSGTVAEGVVRGYFGGRQ